MTRTELGNSGTGTRRFRPDSYLDIDVIDLKSSGNRPIIAVQPTHQEVTLGSTISLNTTALGENLTYQWQRNGNDIPGATSPTLVVGNISKNDTGSYRCRVSNQAGTIYTKAVSLFPRLTQKITPQNETELFNGSDRNTTRWGNADFTENNLTSFAQDGKLFYQVDSPATGYDSIGRGWHTQSLNYSEDWVIQTDVNLPQMNFPHGHAGIGVGLRIHNQSDMNDFAQSFCTPVKASANSVSMSWPMKS